MSQVSRDKWSILKRIILIFCAVCLVLLVLICAFFGPIFLWGLKLKTGLECYQRLELNSAIENYKQAEGLTGYLPDSTDKLTTTLSSLALAYITAGRQEEGEKTLDRNLEVIKGKYGDQSSRLVEPILLKAALIRRQGRYKEAIELYSQALTIARKDGVNSIIYGRAQAASGIFNIYRGKYAEAGEALESAFKIFKDDPGTAKTMLAKLESNLALVREAEGRYQSALEGFARAKKLIDTPGDTNKSALSGVLALESTLYLYVRDFPRARPLITKALELSGERPESGVDKLHTNTLVPLLNMVALKINDYEDKEASRLLELAKETINEDLSPKHISYAMALQLEARIKKKGTLKEKEELLEESEKIFEASVGSNHRYLASVNYDYALILMQSGKLNESQKKFEQSLEILDNCLGKEHPEYSTVARSYAELLKKLGRENEALEYIKSSDANLKKAFAS